MTHRILKAKDEIDAYMHRTRMQMLGVLRCGPATITHIAAELGVHPANLTRHIRILVEADLVSLVEKRDTGRNIEKWYAANATSFEVAPDAEELKAPYKVALSFVRSLLSAAMARLSDKEARPVRTWAIRARLTEGDLDKLDAELERLTNWLSTKSQHEKDSDPYEIVLTFFPGETGKDEGAQTILLSKPGMIYRKSRKQEQ